jgi:signal transduction histidine kinase
LLDGRTATAGEPLPRSIVVLDQFESASAGSAAVLSGFRSALRSSSGPAVSVYVENLDLGRFRGGRFQDAVPTYFREKYEGKPVGLIVAFGSAALEFVLHLRTRLWTEVPVIFAAVDEDALDRLILPANITGRTMRAPLSDSASVARAIVPGLKRLAIVGDPPERQFIRNRAPEELELLAAEFELIDLTRLTMAQLKQRVASLPADSAIIYIGLTIDADNVAYTSRDALVALAGVANRPIVVQAESQLGTGAVGGIVLMPVLVGQEAAQLALRVLAGEGPANIPVTTANVMKPVFDWHQLQRWNVSGDRLPPGSEIRFHDHTIWEQYRAQMIAVIAAILMQAALIAWMLYERQQRRRSEAAAHDLSGRLIHAQEEERSRLARELHDDVTQRLALLAIDAGREERNLSGHAGGAVMRTLREGLVRLSADVHALSYRLHPSILEDLGLTEALKSECERFSQTGSVRLDTNLDEVPERLPRDVALCLFRIAQEGLRNVARHADATRAEVSLRRLNGGLQLAVRDDGTGFDSAAHRVKTSLGHASMRQRAFFLGGRVDIASSPGHGTVITAWVPLKEQRLEPSARSAG